MIADSAALASGSANDDQHYADVEATLRHLVKARDDLANDIKQVLASGSAPSHSKLTSLTARGNALLQQAANLAD